MAVKRIKRNGPKGDRKAYQAWYMRKVYRPKLAKLLKAYRKSVTAEQE